MHKQPIVLDLDGSTGVPDGALHVPLQDWQERLRFGCRRSVLDAFDRYLDTQLPAEYGPVLMGSGDFHHLSLPLVKRLAEKRQRPLRLVVIDNHPDNMRYLFGVHCGSWVRRVAMLPQVSHVHVVGITSSDIGSGHAWENYLTPLLAGKLSYWSVGVDTSWSRFLRLNRAFHNFDNAATLTDAVCAMLAENKEDTYLSIDKDAFSPDVVRTNWDQGQLLEEQLMRMIATLDGQMIASDITGDVSEYRHASAWKRWLSAGDEQTLAIPPATLQAWQLDQQALNQRLVTRLQQAMSTD
ncbi:arginase family protein [Herminiimonas arsenitoxidans]|uniref:arginase family protein n=1 Tax=Herminiimonas arsenitoxidans TaxID=1809410 RepID=UPI00097136BF|nr:arginase family protein [Herminiimonas arsenitoxidans]